MARTPAIMAAGYMATRTIGLLSPQSFRALAAPAAGQVVTSPVAVRGRVTVGPFENTLRGTVYDATDRVVGQGPVMVTPDVSGQLGGPGTFTAQLSFSGAAAGRGRVEVADVSPRDGSILASASVAVVLAGPAGPGSTPTVLPRTGLTSATVVLHRGRPPH